MPPLLELQVCDQLYCGIQQVCFSALQPIVVAIDSLTCSGQITLLNKYSDPVTVTFQRVQQQWSPFGSKGCYGYASQQLMCSALDSIHSCFNLFAASYVRVKSLHFLALFSFVASWLALQHPLSTSPPLFGLCSIPQDQTDQLMLDDLMVQPSYLHRPRPRSLTGSNQDSQPRLQPFTRPTTASTPAGCSHYPLPRLPEQPLPLFALISSLRFILACSRLDSVEVAIFSTVPP